MNLIIGRNRNARIQQEPIIMSSSSSDSPHLRSSIPTSVEIKIKGGRVPKSYVPPPSIIVHEQQKEGGQGSRPIPIKKCRPSLQEMEDEVNSADSASHYDWATWQMYTRIATARRLRAAARYSSSTTSSSSSISTNAGHQLSQQQFHHLIESGNMMHHDILSQEQTEAPTTRDDNDVNDDGGVFAFDMS